MRKKQLSTIRQKKWSFVVMLFLFSNLIAIAQIKTLSGKVSNVHAEGIPGVNVWYKGTTISTITDLEGNYSIEKLVDQEYILVFNAVGYKSQEIPNSNSEIIHVVLESEIALINKDIVVAFDTQNPNSVVAAVSQINGEKLVNAGTLPTVSEALNGLLPGVSAMQSTGKPEILRHHC